MDDSARAQSLFFDALTSLDAGDLATAELLLRDASRLVPNRYSVLSNLAGVLMQRGKFDEARDIAGRAADIDSERIEALLVLARCHAESGRFAEVVGVCDHILARAPDHAQSHNNRGVALDHLKQYDEAITSYRRALALDAGHAEAHSNLGNALRNLNQPDAALASYQQALALNSNLAGAWLGRGNALRDLHRLTEARDCYLRALALEPDHALAHWSLALCSLLAGDYAVGWRHYEWRWKAEDVGAASHARFEQPLWLGDEPLDGKTILLHHEQGYGDTLQFCRYVRQVADRGARVILQVQPALRDLLDDLDGAAEVLQSGAALPPFDCHCPLMSLPLAFSTDASNIPESGPYVRAKPADVANWRTRLGGSKRPRIAIAWSGNANQGNDRNRSMRLADLLPLIDDRADWISLQKDVREADARLLAASSNIRHLGAALTTFADTAAVIAAVDLVISVDTSVAHLAGAMGRPLWVMLTYTPDWRWLLDRPDSPWYPTARLFRQRAVGDWQGVVDGVANALPALPTASALAR